MIIYSMLLAPFYDYDGGGVRCISISIRAINHEWARAAWIENYGRSFDEYLEEADRWAKHVARFNAMFEDVEEEDVVSTPALSTQEYAMKKAEYEIIVRVNLPCGCPAHSGCHRVVAPKRVVALDFSV